MTEQTVNIPLLRKAVEWAEVEAAKPNNGSWEQGAWFVATSVTDPNVVIPEHWDESSIAMRREGYGKPAECGTCYCIAGYTTAMVDGRVDAATVEERAAHLLGLSPYAAADLFCASNSIEDVRRIAEDIAGERL
ncbi:hypothetical protein [uncultured Nocardioides sp.]|jgi:hypothetical protein|uniref:hypothetical protein n=1 Tax=uncultured Nocardioides sp. TaxID=198441 RepID=UPI0026319748|nr:hypothetical protein [uncultured Nocardioides sp.]HRD59345.1 hypothetical protein [Nocardioides sp.]